jgi:hypothetical protein
MSDEVVMAITVAFVFFSAGIGVGAWAVYKDFTNIAKRRGVLRYWGKNYYVREAEPSAKELIAKADRLSEEHRKHHEQEHNWH